MTETFIITGTVTYAMRAREILNRQGIRYHGENCKGRISGYDHTVHGG